MMLREMRVTYDTTRKPGTTRTVLTPAEAAALAHELIGAEVVECALVLLLNARHQLLCWHLVGRGTANQAPIFPRDVFRAAIHANAVGVICAHNHPSGHMGPSAEDRALCARLVEGGKLLGIEVLDFVIVGPEPGGRYSAREAGTLA